MKTVMLTQDALNDLKSDKEERFARLKKSRWFGWSVATFFFLTTLYCLSIIHAQRQFWDQIERERERVSLVQQEQKVLADAFVRSWEGEQAANQVLIAVSGYIKDKQNAENRTKVVWNR